MKINIKSSTMVKPAAETPSDSLWLSSLDLIMPINYHTRTIYFYRFDGAANFFDPTVLKAALSQALVEFYPVAGRLKRDDKGRLEINCNGEGVSFVEAECEGVLDDLGEIFTPKPELNLIPAADYSQGISTFPLFLLQVTRFKCGGVCLGVANEHHLADGHSALHFINTWSDMARGLTIGTRPFFDRRALSALNPPQPKFSHIEYQPPPPLKNADLRNNETAFSVYKLTRDQLNILKAKCKSTDDEQLETTRPNYTTYEVLVGHIWRCVCMARGFAQDQETKVQIPVNGRSRLRPPLPQGFFGNVIFTATAIASWGELISNPLMFTVGKIREAIDRMDDEYMRSALDYLELEGDVYSKNLLGPNSTKCPNLRLTSWVRLPLYDADFGWGKPVYVGSAGAQFEGKSHLMPNPANDGSLLYAITLLKQHMEQFEQLLYDI